jgi:hypothetical protein
VWKLPGVEYEPPSDEGKEKSRIDEDKSLLSTLSVEGSYNTVLS